MRLAERCLSISTTVLIIWFVFNAYMAEEEIYSNSYKNFCIVENFSQSSNTDTFTLGLATHTSIQFLYNIFEQITSFDGSISLSIYIETDIQSTINFINNFYECEKENMRSVHLHLVFRRSFFEDKCPSFTRKRVSCRYYNRLNVLQFLGSLPTPELSYPINLMRNIARKASPSHISILSDIEMIFMRNVAKMVSPILKKRNRRIAFIIRRFEIEESMNYPRNMKELHDMYKNGTAIVFHNLYFPEGHSIERLDEWFNYSLSTNRLKAFRTNYKNSNWEPQIVLSKDDPLHDEDIPTRHRDHQALVYELCRAGHSFYVLSHVFNVHRGFKKHTSGHEAKTFLKGIPNVESASTNFIRRMNRLYPNTGRTCHKWNNNVINK